MSALTSALVLIALIITIIQWVEKSRFLLRQESARREISADLRCVSETSPARCQESYPEDRGAL